MSSRKSLTPRGRERRNDRPNRNAFRLGLTALFVALAAPAALYGVRHADAQGRTGSVQGRSATGTTTQQVAGPEAPLGVESVKPASVTTVSFQQLSERQTPARGVVGRGTATTLRSIHTPLTVPEAPSTLAPDTSVSVAEETVGPLVPSPSPAQSFLAQEDGPKVGTAGSFTIPPDTNGAVGINKVFTNTNSNYRVHDKTTGAALSTVSTDTFWASSGGSGFFDPQIQYDPYNQRWILVIASNAQSTSSSISIAVSTTSDPQGTYNVYRYTVAATIGGQPSWADFPMLGFNKNWVAVGMNMFTNATNAFAQGRVLVIDYAALRAGAANPAATSFNGTGACEHPVTTYSPTENSLYLVKHVSASAGTYRVTTIQGTPTAPTVPFGLGGTKTRPGGGWIDPNAADLVPQQCIVGSPLPTYACPATPAKVNAGDSQVRSNPVFRNGKVYWAQVVGINTDGVAATIEHTAAQWTVADVSPGPGAGAAFAVFVDGGRVEDATATPANGGKWYTYPSLSVNRNGDILMGFSEGESDDYVDAGYTFRLSSDAAGTMRDPVIYKEGEDYYFKDFGTTVNRWGDYSHTVVDPVNDRDLWTVQEYAQTRVSATNGLGTNDSRWSTYWAKVQAPAGVGELLISEFRLNGPAGDTDEFIEVYNNSDVPHQVAATDGTGYALYSSSNVTLNDGTPTLRCTILNGTTIPARGHFLCANSGGYSLGNYPAGVATTASPDATYLADIPLNAGLALFNTTTVGNFSTSTRIDAAGSNADTNALYREGAGYPAITASNTEYSFLRDQCGKGGSLTQLGGCPTLGLPKDTGDNAADFIFVDTGGISKGAGQRLGAPGPETTTSPLLRNSQMPGFLLDVTTGASNAPNRVRDFTPGPATTSTQGTLEIRRRVTNNTGQAVTRLRFRIIDMTTFPVSFVAPGFADLRAITSSNLVVSNINDNATCGAPQVPPATSPTAPCNVTVYGTTLEETTPGVQQPNGGGFNSSLSVTLPGALAPGASINVRWVLGVQSSGTFKFLVNIEALP